MTVTKIDPSGGRALVRGFGPTSGKWYYEARILSGGTSLGASFTIGWGPVSQNDSQYLCSLNNVYAGPSNTQSPTYTGTQTDWIAMCAIDVDAGLVWYGANGQWHKGENPADGVNTYWTWPKPDPSDLWVMKNDHSYNGTGSVEIQTSPRYAPEGFYGNLALVLASNKDLIGDSAFAEDDPVQQDSGYTPETSAITSIDPSVNIGSYTGEPYGASNTGGVSNMFAPGDDGLGWRLYLASQNYASPGFAEITFNSAQNLDTIAFRYDMSVNTPGIRAPMTCRITSDLGDRDITFEVANTLQTVTKDVSSYPNITKLRIFATGTGQAVEVYAFYANGVQLIDPTITSQDEKNVGTFVSPAVLTFADDTDLENFRVGDPVAVQPAPGSGTKGYLTPNPGGSNPGDMTTDLTYFWGNAFDGNPNTIGSFAQANLIGDPVTYSSEVAIKADGAGQYARINEGEWIGPLADKDWTTLATGSGVLHSLAITNDAAGKTAAGYARGTLVDGGELTFGPAAFTPFATVESIDEGANQMTITDVQGDWSTASGKVSGPATDPGTGIVVSTDSATNTMVLKNVDEIFPERWIVNQGKYVIGEQTPSMNAAPDADGLTLIATDFVDSPYGSLTHSSSDWQVTAFSDTSYSAPVASATGDATNKNDVGSHTSATR